MVLVGKKRKLCLVFPQCISSGSFWYAFRLSIATWVISENKYLIEQNGHTSSKICHFWLMILFQPKEGYFHVQRNYLCHHIVVVCGKKDQDSRKWNLRKTIKGLSPFSLNSDHIFLSIIKFKMSGYHNIGYHYKIYLFILFYQIWKTYSQLVVDRWSVKCV